MGNGRGLYRVAHLRQVPAALCERIAGEMECRTRGLRRAEGVSDGFVLAAPEGALFFPQKKREGGLLPGGDSLVTIARRKSRPPGTTNEIT